MNSNPLLQILSVRELDSSPQVAGALRVISLLMLRNWLLHFCTHERLLSILLQLPLLRALLNLLRLES